MKGKYLFIRVVFPNKHGTSVWAFNEMIWVYMLGKAQNLTWIMFIGSLA